MSKLTTTTQAAQPFLRFAVRITPTRGADAAVLRQFVGRFDEFLAQADLYFGGSPWLFVVRSDSRDLTVADQVEILNWILEDEIGASAAISPLTRCVADDLNEDSAWLLANRQDLAVAAINWLYRWDRIDAGMFFRILARGAVTQVHQ